ncbi:MAG: PDZ domain-containing protein, partial [Terriglobales bacterium]
ADTMGVRPDDVITEVNRQPVRRRADLDRLLAAVPKGSDLALLLRRPNGDGTDSRWLVGGTLPPPQL